MRKETKRKSCIFMKIKNIAKRLFSFVIHKKIICIALTHTYIIFC